MQNSERTIAILREHPQTDCSPFICFMIFNIWYSFSWFYIFILYKSCALCSIFPSRPTAFPICPMRSSTRAPSELASLKHAPHSLASMEQITGASRRSFREIYCIKLHYTWYSKVCWNPFATSPKKRMETPALAENEQSEVWCLVPLRRNRAKTPFEEMCEGDSANIRFMRSSLSAQKIPVQSSHKAKPQKPSQKWG